MKNPFDTVNVDPSKLIATANECVLKLQCQSERRELHAHKLRLSDTHEGSCLRLALLLAGPYLMSRSFVLPWCAFFLSFSSRFD